MKDLDRMTTAQKAECVLGLLSDMPAGVIRDADTVLKDIMDDADFEISGIAGEIIGIWKRAADKESVEKLFQCFTDYSFNGWLDKCIRETTRKSPGTDGRLAEAEKILSARGVPEAECRDAMRELGKLFFGEDPYQDDET